MPTCMRCGITQATVEMRRSPKKADDGSTLWLCKSIFPCKARRKEARLHEKARKRSLSR